MQIQYGLIRFQTLLTISNVALNLSPYAQWNTPQTVRIKALPDNKVEGLKHYTLYFETRSKDENFNLFVDTVSVLNVEAGDRSPSHQSPIIQLNLPLLSST